MKSRHKRMLGLLCIVAVGALLGRGRVPDSLPDAQAAAAKPVLATIASIASAPPAAVASGGPVSEPRGEPRSESESPRMAAQASRDLFASKSWLVAPPPAPLPKPVAPPFPYTYSGSMRGEGADDGVILFLIQNDRIVIVRKGETIGGNYRLDDIKENGAVAESVAIFTYLPLQEKQRLTMGNNP